MTTATVAAAADPASQPHPPGLYTLFFTEMWERFSYYGMRALLVLFMVDAIEKGGLGLTEKNATAIYGLYTALVYVVALPGGWIADRLLGAQKSVWYGGLLIAAGHFTLAVPRREAFVIGLLLIVLGTGLLKPNISVIVGHLYPEGGSRRDAGFTIFYMGINIGAALGPLICSALGEQVNWHMGFAAAGVGMVLALIIFQCTKHRLGDAGLYPSRAASGESRRSVMPWGFVIGGLITFVSVTGLTMQGTIPFEPVVLSKYTTYLIFGVGGLFLLRVFALGGLSGIEFKRMGVLVMLLLACALFWSGFEQAGSSLNIFAKEYTVRAVSALKWEIPAGWFQSLNPVFIIVLAPVMASLWVGLSRRGTIVSIPAKFAWGLILMGLGFLVMYFGSRGLGPSQRVWPTWLIATYLVHTLGELCLSPVGLSAVTKLAPQRFVGQMMGMWFLSTSLGNLLAALMASEAVATIDQFPTVFLRITAMAVGAGAILLVLAWPLSSWGADPDAAPADGKSGHA